VIFVIINCQFINDAVNCVKLASEVLFQNAMLIIQPIYNIIFKLLFLIIFIIFIVQAMSTGGFAASVIAFTVPPTSAGGSTYEVSIGGMARSLDILYNPTKMGVDIYYLWIEVFVM
jgi:hypothetical protein